MERHVVLLFVDGFGLGVHDASINPLVAAKLLNLSNLACNCKLTIDLDTIVTGDRAVVPTDAQLGLSGIPQSATGQASLLTGVNAAQLVGRHVNGYPNSALKQLLKERSIFSYLNRLGLRAAFLNAFRPRSLDLISNNCYPASCTSVAALEAGIYIRTIEDLRAGLAVTHDILRRTWRLEGYDVPLVTAEEAASHAAQVINSHEFTLFEYFLTDVMGHHRDMERSISVLDTFDAFVGALWEQLNPKNTTLFISSDHGNIEDVRVKTHTLNPVPTIVAGRKAGECARQIKSLPDVFWAVLTALDVNVPKDQVRATKQIEELDARKSRKEIGKGTGNRKD